MYNYKDSRIYREAYSLTKEIYFKTRTWPSEETFSLISQIRRSAHSVNSNICEGLSRATPADCLRFVYSAYASLKETENHLNLARDLGYMDNNSYLIFSRRVDILSGMIWSLIQHLKEK